MTAEDERMDAEAQAVDLYDKKDEAYFSYYSQLTHQAQMLQAGAALVYAVEASDVIGCLHRLVAASSGEDENAPNAWMRDRLGVDVTPQVLEKATPRGLLPADTEQVDTIVSECLGVLLVHERMCESFLEARDKFLRPGGALFPRTGTLCFSLLNDARLWQEVRARADWWNTTNFYGVDLTPFLGASRTEAFQSPVVGCFSPTHVVGAQTDLSTAAILCPDEAVCKYLVDFGTVSSADLRTFDVPIAFDCVDEPTVVHGLGAWFDLSFLQPGEVEEDDLQPCNAMTTSPFAPPTHWAQVRMLFHEPLALNTGQRVLGTLHFEANESRSYDIRADLYVPLPDGIGGNTPLFRRTALWKLDKQTYSWETPGA